MRMQAFEREIKENKTKQKKRISTSLLFCFVFRATCVWHTEVPRLGVKLELCHSHRNAGSELGLRPTPQLTGNAGSLTH